MMHNQALTKRQAQILRFVKHYLRKRGYAPTRREIGEHFNLAISTVHAHVISLLKRGVLIRSTGTARALRVPGKEDYTDLAKHAETLHDTLLRVYEALHGRPQPDELVPLMPLMAEVLRIPPAKGDREESEAVEYRQKEQHAATTSKRSEKRTALEENPLGDLRGVEKIGPLSSDTSRDDGGAEWDCTGYNFPVRGRP